MFQYSQAITHRLLAATLISPVLVGCSVSLQDRTPDPLVADAPPNEQIFIANVEPGRRNTIKEVSIRIDGQSSPLAPYRANEWIAGVERPRCEGVVEYTYDVTYERDGASQTKQFPSNGTFLRRIEGSPLDCVGAMSETYVTNSSIDLPDTNPGDGICSAGPSIGLDGNPVAQACTLRAAVMEANATAGINFIAVRPATYVVHNEETPDEDHDAAIDSIGDLDITDDVIIATELEFRTGCIDNVEEVFERGSLEFHDYIDGTPEIARVDGDSRGRVFDIHDRPDGSAIRVEMICLAVTGGLVPSDEDGRGQGGGIFNRGDLNLQRVIIARNHAFGDKNGAGISNRGNLRITDSAFLNNGSGEGGRLVGGLSGGAIASSDGYTSISRSGFFHNMAGRGGALYVTGARASITNSSLYENHDRAPQHWPTRFRAGSGNGFNIAIMANKGARIRVSNVSLGNLAARAFHASSDSNLFVDRSIIWTNALTPDGEPYRVLCNAAKTLESRGSNFYRSRGSECFDTPARTDIFAGQFDNPFGRVESDAFAPVLSLSSPIVYIEAVAQGRDAPELGIYDHGARPYKAGTVIFLPCTKLDQRGFARSVASAPGRRVECDIGAYEFGASQ